MLKKGQGLSVNAIILIVLGVIILVVLVIGFTVGWSVIFPWLPTNNVKTIVQNCNAACVTNSKFDFCSSMRDLKDGKTEITTSCATFSVISEYDKYGIDECPSISCDFECESIKIGKEGEQRIGYIPENSGLCDEVKDDDVTSIAKVTGTQKCCVPKIQVEEE